MLQFTHKANTTLSHTQRLFVQHCFLALSIPLGFPIIDGLLLMHRSYALPYNYRQHQTRRHACHQIQDRVRVPGEGKRGVLEHVSACKAVAEHALAVVYGVRLQGDGPKDEYQQHDTRYGHSHYVHFPAKHKEKGELQSAEAEARRVHAAVCIENAAEVARSDHTRTGCMVREECDGCDEGANESYR
jgi:hypothetical protein